MPLFLDHGFWNAFENRLLKALQGIVFLAAFAYPLPDKQAYWELFMKYYTLLIILCLSGFMVTGAELSEDAREKLQNPVKMGRINSDTIRGEDKKKIAIIGATKGFELRPAGRNGL